MANYYDSKTPNWQRITIWVIAIAMAGGTLLTFFFMAFAAHNPDVDPGVISQNKQMEEYQKQMEEYQKQMEERKKLYRALEGFENSIGPFDADAVTELKVVTLKEGEGATVGAESTITANYTGWLPDGTIFESTKLEGSDPTPAEFPINGVIEGWAKGLIGQRAGGVYELTIPAAMAYGAQGSGSIPPDMPLRFLVQIVDVQS
ncbi:FKBP-type peptidyl-prolyl cis-trans isomerase [Candidatus Saccharibacteria bacterium]|nr:FKBP-type peptidyl-prolyl cis-trans isomerase [Candidatus Saccharibacteria bacterium]